MCQPKGNDHSQVKTVPLFAGSEELAQLLGRISSEESKQGRGMLSVIVVHKHGDMEPGAGFYDLAESLGFDAKDRLKFWISELHKVHHQWSNKQNTSPI